MKIAVVGANGFVGSAVCSAINEMPEHTLIKVLRGDDFEDKFNHSDLIIYSANPAARFKAESNQHQDFLATVEKTSKSLSLVANKKVIMISSLSCRTQLDTSYGRNRRSCELIALAQGAVVIRLGPMFGGDRKQDVLHDILAGRKVYVAGNTRYSYTDVEWNGHEIITYIDAKCGIYELGANNAVSLGYLRDLFGSSSEFQGMDDTQIANGHLRSAGPDATLVIQYAERELLNIDSWK
jgi:nucleoside-diphosphate-sugar epimerase